jgi:hypothetical protein
LGGFRHKTRYCLALPFATGPAGHVDRRVGDVRSVVLREPPGKRSAMAMRLELMGAPREPH